MRRLAATVAVSAVALTACTQSIGQAVGELTRGNQGGAVYTPTPQPAKRQASAPAPAPTPVAAPAPQPERRQGFHLPGMGRKDSTTAAATPAPQPKAAPQPQVAAAPPAGAHHFLGFAGFPLVKDAGPPQTEVLQANDPTSYRQVTLQGLSKGVKDNSLPVNLPLEVTATVDGRFNRQIVVDIRGGDGLAISRREGDCIQVLLPFPLDQKNFASGRYMMRGVYRRQWMPVEGFMYEMNRYEPACGDAYFFVRSIVHAS